LYDIVLYNGHRLPSGQTWQMMLRPCNPCSSHYHTPYLETVRLLGSILLLLYGGALFLLTGLDLLTYCTVAILLFLLLSKIVYEQYFLWVMPFLIFDLVERRSRSAGILLAALSILGVLDNEQIHPLHLHEHGVAVTEYAAFIAVELCIAVYLVMLLVPQRPRSLLQPRAPDDGQPA
jgi:hypothetical protein